MKNRNGIYRIGENTWQIRYFWMGLADVYMYLLTGKEKALLIDSGYSDTDAYRYVRSVTDLPVILVNTHGHMDHCGGNGDFKEAYLSEEDVPVYRQFAQGDYTRKMFQHAFDVYHIPHWIQNLPKIHKAVEAAAYMKTCTLLPLPEKGYFDLGDRKVYFRLTPGHTPGSIVLADEKTGILFTGDNLCEDGILLGFDHSSPLHEYRQSLDVMADLCQTFHLHHLDPSHHKTDLPVSRIRDCMELCDSIIHGKTKGKYTDNGLNQGYKVKYKGLSLIYREI